MRLCLLGDAHYTDRRPERRLDKDFFSTQLQKTKQIVSIYCDYDCDMLIQVGDWFDSYRASNLVKSALIALLKTSEMDVVCIWGQHDISGHSETTYPNSPLRVLEAARVVKVVKTPEQGLPVVYEKGDVVVAGACFGQKVPKIRSVYDGFHILVTHQMIGNKSLFPGQQIIHPRNFLARHKDFDLIVCGDYHYRFIEERAGVHCINPGALVRKSINSRDLAHKPAVVIYDTGSKTVEVVELDITPSEEIFDMRKEERMAEDNTALLEFLENLKKSEGTAIGWKEIFLRLCEEGKIEGGAKEAVEECILEIEKGLNDV
ncbi:MAG: metallophosphoesterase family protein [Candidatus Thorarchaeota archaeon]